jgi:hypothetical protein
MQRLFWKFQLPLFLTWSERKKRTNGNFFVLISWVFIRSSSYLWSEYRIFIEYSEISNFNPQTEYFHEKVYFQLFIKCYFGGGDVENWVWTKLSLWMCSILWIRVKIGYTQLSLKFFYYYRPIWPVYHTSKKWFFSMFNKWAASADINEKKLGKVVYNLFWPESII